MGQVTYNLVPRFLDQEDSHLYTCGDIHETLTLMSYWFVSLERGGECVLHVEGRKYIFGTKRENCG